MACAQLQVFPWSTYWYLPLHLSGLKVCMTPLLQPPGGAASEGGTGHVNQGDRCLCHGILVERLEICAWAFVHLQLIKR